MVALHFALEHTAGPDIGLLNRGEILLGEGFTHPRKQPVGLAPELLSNLSEAATTGLSLITGDLS